MLIQEILDELSWSATTSDGLQIDVRDGRLGEARANAGGADVKGTAANDDDSSANAATRSDRWTSSSLGRYVQGVVRTRLLESQHALRAISEGLRSVVPGCALGIFAWYELELRVCGRAEIDVDLLKRNTEYDDDVSADEPAIVWLWETLEEFTHQQRCDFLRFVWARSHLPPTAAEFKQKFKVQSPVTDGARQTPDLYLPKAHTCFFSINLPRYSSKAILRQKLEFAMANCVEMDADFRLAGNEVGAGWVLPTTE